MLPVYEEDEDDDDDNELVELLYEQEVSRRFCLSDSALDYCLHTIPWVRVSASSGVAGRVFDLHPFEANLEVPWPRPLSLIGRIITCK